MAMKKTKGLREGVDESGLSLRNAEKADGLNWTASAGIGRPVNLANAVRSHRTIAKIPRTWPSVSLRFPNCSATETMAGDSPIKELACRY